MVGGEGHSKNVSPNWFGITGEINTLTRPGRVYGLVSKCSRSTESWPSGPEYLSAETDGKKRKNKIVK